MQNEALCILLIDDSEEFYHQVRDLLNQIQTFQVTLVWMAMEDAAREAICQSRGATQYDAYLIGQLKDYHLLSGPGKDSSLTLLQIVRGYNTTAPVIVFTETLDAGWVALQAGAADYLEKHQLSVSLLERSLRLTLAHTRTQVALTESEARYRTLVEAGFNLAETTLKENTQIFRRLAETLKTGFSNIDEDSLINFEQLANEIQKRQQVEERLRESEALLRSMTDASPLAFYVVDNRSDAILYFNHRFCEIWGIEHLEPLLQEGKLKNNDLVSYCLAQVLDQPTFIASCKPLQYEENRAVVEDEFPFVNGRMIRRFSSQIRGENDRYFGRLYVFEDISDRLAAEAALQRSETRFQRLAENLPGVIYQYRQFDAIRDEFTYISSGCRNLYELEPEAVLQDASLMRSVIHPDDLNAFQQSFNPTACTGHQWQHEWRIITPSGKLKWIRGLARTERQPDGTLVWDGLFFDISDRKHAQEQLQASNERYRIVSELISDYAYAVRLNPNGTSKLDWITDAFIRISGYTLKEIEARGGWQTLLHPDDLPIGYQRAQKLLSGEPDISEYRIITKSGEVRWLRDYGHPVGKLAGDSRCGGAGVQGEDGLMTIAPSPLFIYGGAQDITAQKIAEEQLRYRLILETALAEVSRELVSNEQMDLNTVLGILGSAVRANRAYLMRFRNTTRIAEAHSEWCSHDTSPQIEYFRQVETAHFPWWIEQLRRNRNIVIPDIEALPEAAQATKTFFQALNVCSVLAVPIYNRSGQLWGTIGLNNTVGNPKNWPDEDAQLLRIVGEMIYSHYERNLAQDQLRASEALYAGIFNHSAESIFLINVLPNGQFVYETLNPAHEKATGIAVDDLAGKSPHEVLSPDMAAHVEHRYNACINSGKPITYEETLTLPGGTRIWRTTLVPIRDATGRIVKLQGGARDITEEKQVMAEQLRQTRYRHLLTSLTLKIRQSLQINEILQTTVTELQKTLVCDRVLFFRLLSSHTGKVVNEAVDSSWPTLLGKVLQIECLSGQSFDKFSDGQVYTCADVSTASVLPDYPEFLQHYQIRSQLIVPILVNRDWGLDARTLYSNQGNQQENTKNSQHLASPQSPQLWGLLVVQQCSDTLQWKTYEIELLQQLANQLGIALYQAQLLEHETRQRQELARSNAELEQFAYVASHDLQEPLRTLASYTKLLQRRYQGQLDEKADRFIDHIVDGSRRMQTLINDLLQYSRVGRSQKAFESTDCNWVLEQAVANLHQSISNNQAVITCSQLPTLMADSSQLIQLFQNLISNAIKYRREEAPVVYISAEHQDDIWQFSVTDNGIGIAAPYQSRIFQIFQRLHTQDEYPGTGIGLAICHKIVECYGGRIWVESQIDQGSTFYFTVCEQNDATFE